MKVISLLTISAAVCLGAGEAPTPTPAEVAEAIKQAGAKVLPKTEASGMTLDWVIPADIAAVEQQYTTYRKMLAEPKSIGTEFAERCDDSPIQALRKQYGPHAGYHVQHFRNPIADDAKDAKAWPVGSILVKQKLWLKRAKVSTAKPTVYGIAGMIKRAPGTHPKSGDWEFFSAHSGKFEPVKMEACAGCHSGAAKDYVFTSFPEKTTKP